MGVGNAYGVFGYAAAVNNWWMPVQFETINFKNVVGMELN